VTLMYDDSHEPPFYSVRNLGQFAMTSGKRAHSPDGNLGDRPSKRLSLATGDVSIGYRHFSTSSRSEDWVQQAGGLTINSPIFSLTAHCRTPVQALDVEMSIDPGPSGVQPLQTPLHPTPTPQHQHTLIESDTHSETIQPLFDEVSPTPVMFTVTAPPDKHQSEEQHPSTRPSTPPDSSSNPMILSSPVASLSQIPSSSTKRRVFFGPRTGCEKCRLAVKGHFVHVE